MTDPAAIRAEGRRLLARYETSDPVSDRPSPTGGGTVRPDDPRRLPLPASHPSASGGPSVTDPLSPTPRPDTDAIREYWFEPTENEATAIIHVLCDEVDRRSPTPLSEESEKP